MRRVASRLPVAAASLTGTSKGQYQRSPVGRVDNSFNLRALRIFLSSQPVSSVATSLADGESIEKYVEDSGQGVRAHAYATADRDIDLADRIAITKYLKRRANSLWDERAVAEGEEELPRMLPIVRLKVDTTGVSKLSNPVRFGQEFQGQLANPRDVLVFHRAKVAARRRGPKVTADQHELSIDDPDLSISEKLSKVRAQTLAREYLAAQELQLLGEVGMPDSIETFMDKDDIHAIQTRTGPLLPFK
ncbi:Mre11 DNA-binding presumed domain-containing protein [Fomitopsis serialis]|uniref:Mre11 DNA-binding presumed domain-containing protein n=1 Tax=Fomitopsis serialis TaxID=139415 RepID=UPI002007A24F|nr:Mre11 DNA-binding presumed domain-containing protein [Neoantrodia serialis]KAH9918836.1 Mre11 DNA-binding presumed domain-containing protein [Neoantrodia serialis]